MDFAGRRVMVTGAGKGIGRTLVETLRAQGAEVTALTRSAGDVADLAALGVQALAVDLADAGATRAALGAALPCDFLVNNAGTTELEGFLDTSAEAFDRLMAVNVRAALLVGQHYARDRIARGLPGAIVNVSSAAAFRALPDHASYCASKAALDALTRVMALELGPRGIRVNAVNPTVTLTPMAVKAWSDPEKAGGMLARIPLGRFATPQDVCGVILFLLSDAAAMVSGLAMPVDGGFLAG
jgi:L-xylulose reductase